MLFDVLSRIFFPVVATLITDPVKDYVVKPIKRHISYVFNCDSKVKRLQDEVENLKNKKLRLQQSVVEASRNAEQIHENVNKWLSTAGNEIEEAETLIQGKEEATKKCFVGLCPNLKTRYQLSKRADKKVLAIDKQLQNAEGLSPLSFRPAPQQIVEPSSYSREGLPSRVLMLNQIVDALKDPNLNMIGVYGMGGVGKTTLAKEVQARAVQEKLFETVIMVAVSQTPELRRIQSEIADFLGLKFDVEEVPGRASRLYDRLKNSKVLIILDDIWQKLELKSVGIPFGEECKSCKILLTSRRRDVLSSEMETQKEFLLDVLGEEEAWSLFQVIVARTRDPKLHPIAIEIAKKCSGLPLLILIVAKELQNKESYAWIDMLKQLSVSGNEDIHNKVHKVLESSFNNLPGEEVKSLFLLCALFPQSNIRIQNLLIYSMGLSLFKHRITIEEARNRLLTLINKLKAECLLLDGDMDGFVKMHDVVRDAAISIASISQHAFVGASQVRLTDWPKQDCNRISLPYCDVRELPTILECPKADLLLLFTEDLCLEIPGLFFEEVRQLKVLDFTGMRMVSLPSSLVLLVNLHSLCLHKCRLDDVAVIGELKQLELLSFADSEIVELPREIEALTKLKLLDVRNCSNLQVIPANAISKLCSLEELYMLNSFVRWDVKGNASLVELENLSHLSTLEIQILNPQLIPKGGMLFDRLQSHKISIGNKWNWDGKYDMSRTLKLQLRANGVGGVIHLEDGIKVLLRGTEDLYLEVGGIESVLYDLQREGFPQLKHLHIQNDFGVQHLIKSTTRAFCHAFGILESLSLYNLNSLEKICDGQLAIGSFEKLQTINIRSCKQMKSLFSVSSVKCLWQLQEMDLGYCNNMETIVGQGSEDYNSSNEVIELPQLSSLKLSTLPHLTGFCKRKERLGQLELLLNQMVVFPNLTSLDLYNCESLKYVFTTSMVNYLIQLKTLQVGFCERVEEIIESKNCGEIEERVDKIVFPKLDYVRLYSLPNMKNFSCGYPIEFQTLRELKIERCYALKNIVSKFPGRSNSSENDDYLFTEMVAFSNLEILHITDTNKFRYLWHEQFAADDSFSKLKALNIHSCSKLSIVFTSNVLIRFRRLETLQVSSCESVQEIYQYQGTQFEEMKAFSLQKFELFCLPSLKHIWSKDACEAFTFENLRIVYVLYCKDLKYVFPESIACRLFHLEDLKIEYCDVEVIIAKAEDEESESEPSFFMFPQLTSLQLVHLKEMRSLYDGSYTFEWPKLKLLEVTGCSKVMEFGSKTHASRQQDKEIEKSQHFVEKLIPTTEEMIIDNQGLQTILSSELLVEFTSKLKKLTLCTSEEESVSCVFGFLGQLYSLEILSLEDIFLLDDERAVGEAQHHPRLKHLKLGTVRNLNQILKKDSLLNPILPYLQTLEVQNCDDLMNIAPFSGSFGNLTVLDVKGCKEMMNLLTMSTAKNMVQLVELRVSDCPIIAQSTMRYFSKKLKKLTLAYLNLLNSFSPDNRTFNFPLLEEVIVYGCSKMKIFSGGILSTPKLRGILFEYEQQWEGNLNATIACQLRKWNQGKDGTHFLLHVEEGTHFQNVESLEVAKDAFSSKAILANQMQLLNKLRRITVRDCDLIHVVFDLEGLSAEEGHVRLLPQLNELHLINLPILSQLCNTAPQGILDFSKLEVLKIDNCRRLEYAFTWSMASCLFHLQRVEMKNCEKMEIFIKGEEADREDAAQVIFGSLESIVVECLPKFSSFYSGSGDVECPSLKKICIRECPRIKGFISRLTREDHDIHFSHKVLPDLEIFSVDVKSMSAILQFEELPTNFFSKVKDLDLGYFSATTKPDLPLLHFLSTLPSLHEFEVCHSSLKELFKFEGLNTNLEEATTLPQIRSLKLQDLDDLNQIWWQNSQFHVSLFQSLETLRVMSCGNLICLASAPASFENLTSLEVDGCNQLKILITLSVAKSMVQLETLSVTSCSMLTEIVGDGNDDRTTSEIVFTKMKSIYINDLQRLKCFSFGRSTFKFPCLERLILIKCPNLGIFCPGTIITPMLDSIIYHFDKKLYSKGDVNTIVENMYEKMVSILSSSPNMKMFTEQVSTAPKLWRVKTGIHEYEWEWEGNLNNTIQALFVEKDV